MKYFLSAFGLVVLATLWFFWSARAPTTQLVDAAGRELTAGSPTPQPSSDSGGEPDLFDPARALMEAEDWGAAKTELLRLIDASDRDGEACTLLCEVTRELEEVDAAVDYGLKATELLPESAPAHLAYAEAIGAQLMQGGGGLSAMMGKLGQLKRFQAECARVIELDPEDTEARTMLGFGLLLAPKMLGGDPERGLELCREVQVLDPVAGGQLVAFGLSMTGDLEGALAACEAGLAAHPEERMFEVTRAGILAGAERFEEAHAAYLVARPAGGSPDEAYYRSLHGQASLWIEQEEELEAALAHLETFLQVVHEEERMPSPEDAWWRRGEALRLLGRVEEARTAYGEALALEPDYTAAQESLDALGN